MAIAKLFEGWFRLRGQKWYAVGDMPVAFQAKPDSVEDDGDEEEEEEEEEPRRPVLRGKQPPPGADPAEQLEWYVNRSSRG